MPLTGAPAADSAAATSRPEALGVVGGPRSAPPARPGRRPTPRRPLIRSGPPSGSHSAPTAAGTLRRARAGTRARRAGRRGPRGRRAPAAAAARAGSPVRPSTASSPWPGAGVETSIASGAVARGPQAQPPQAGGGQDQRVGVAARELVEAGAHVAADRHDDEVRAGPPGSEPPAAGSRWPRGRPPAGREPAGRAHQHVARVLARRHRDHVQAARELGRQVLGRVDGQVGPAVEQRLLELLHEQALVGCLAGPSALQRSPVVVRGERLGLVPGLAQRGGHELGLGQRQGRAARREDQVEAATPRREAIRNRPAPRGRRGGAGSPGAGGRPRRWPPPASGRWARAGAC